MNPLFQWDPARYSVYVPEMDNEHQKLIQLMNVVYEASQNQKPKTEILKALDNLQSFVVEHFKHEEQYFSQLPGYPQVESHKKIHADLIHRFQDLYLHFKNSPHTTLSPAFFHFLKVWLTAHIAGCDRQYGEYAVKKKAG